MEYFALDEYTERLHKKEKQVRDDWAKAVIENNNTLNRIRKMEQRFREIIEADLKGESTTWLADHARLALTEHSNHR